MRGKLKVVVMIGDSTRNIPAYAGKTIPFLAGNVKEREHPRVCGENCGSCLHAEIIIGTSPRMRGKPTGGM